jgi:hypothetical protein
MKRMLHPRRTVIWLGLALVLFHTCEVQTCAAYSVLTHEEVVDLLWKDGIQPLLKQRFPAATDDELKGPRLCLWRIAGSGHGLLSFGQ